ncbi:MAG: zinc ribbon domain-containing protein [Gemmataceae bacterium]|nr:zinc ribbon domain-containing protein [Gemmataceae bacterium]
MIRVTCPTCGLKLQVPPERAGGVVACSECGEQLRVPGHRPPPPREPAPRPLPRRASPEPPSEDPPGTLIFCYACKKQVANNASVCPKCGAAQTAAGREEGRRLMKMADRITSVVGVVILAPMLLMCLICGFGGFRSSAPPPGPEQWDMDRLKQDVNRAVREPGKTIFVPADGSQPVVVPDPDAP